MLNSNRSARFPFKTFLVFVTSSYCILVTTFWRIHSYIMYYWSRATKVSCTYHTYIHISDFHLLPQIVSRSLRSLTNYGIHTSIHIYTAPARICTSLIECIALSGVYTFELVRYIYINTSHVLILHNNGERASPAQL